MPNPAITPAVSIVLIVDGLSPRYLSPYGCTWIDTPSLNRLAADSIVFENAVAESTDAATAFRAILSRCPSLRPPTAATAAGAFFSGQEGRAHRCLLSDNLDLADEERLSDCFDEVVSLPPAADFAGKTGIAGHVAETHLGHCFAQIISEIQNQNLPLLLVAHLTSLGTVWDSPRAMREKYCGDEDPPPFAGPIPPRELASAADEGRYDEILGITRALAGQIGCFDDCLGILLDILQESSLYDHSLIALITPTAFPVGHHDVIGPANGHLYSDCLDVPLLIKLPGEAGSAAWRDYGLIQPSQVLPLLADLYGNDPGGVSQLFQRKSADAVVCVSGSSRAIRTTAWFLVKTPEQCSLFVKPDDRWDANPVEDRCREIATALVAVLDRMTVDGMSGQLPACRSLPAALTANDHL